MQSFLRVLNVALAMACLGLAACASSGLDGSSVPAGNSNTSGSTNTGPSTGTSASAPTVTGSSSSPGASTGTGGASNSIGSGSSTNSGGSPSSGAANTGTQAPRWAVDVVMEEPLAPFSSWLNVKTRYGAVGDGNADDTAALQSGLDALSTGRAQVLYLPPGTYKISATLNLTGSPTSGSGYFGWGGVGIIGADPSTTIIKWAGPAGQPMLIQNGGLGTRYNRITWDGSGTAGYGVAHWWNAKGGGIYGGSFEHQDEVFENMAIGIMGGRLGRNYGQLDSEGQVRRVSFINDTYAGLDTGSFNALDWWVWDSQFINCARGVSNEYSLDDSGVTTGAGAMYVYRSLFKGSTVADFAIGNTGWFSLHNNVSIGSALFIQALPMGENPAVVIAQNNRVVQSTGASPISYGNTGPLLLVDNEIQAKSSTYTIADYVSDIDVLALGNQTTAGFPAATGSARLLSVANTTIAASSLSTQPLVLPATPSVVTHQVYEVPAGASAAQIQALIDQSLTSGDSQPIIHFAQGRWSLDTALHIPQHGSVQLVGDGYGSVLTWSGGSGAMLNIAAPAKVTIRDMQWTGSVSAVSISGADQAGGRIQLVGSALGPISATHLHQTQLSLQANPVIAALSLTDVVNAVAMGNGVVGPLTMASNSSFLMSDSWYEGNATALFTIPNGTFTYLGGHMAPASHGANGNDVNVPAVLLNGFAGTASWIGMRLDLKAIPSGIGVDVKNESAQTKAYFVGNSSGANGGSENNWFKRAGGGGEVSFNLNRNTSGQYANQGDTSSAAIVNAWQQARSLNWDSAPYQVPAGSLDVKLYHVKMNQTAGLVINGQ